MERKHFHRILVTSALIGDLAAGLMTVKPAAAATLQSAATITAPYHVCIPDRPPRSIPPHPIVAFGDSITWGWYASHNCVPRSSTILPLTAHEPARTDTTYPGMLSRL